jgi:HK97 family phage portal protein
VIRFPGPVKEEQIDALRKRWEERQAGLAERAQAAGPHEQRRREGALLKPQDAQLLESKRFSVEDICRPFGVPPFMVGATDKVTSFGSGVEHMGQGFIRFTLTRHINPLEQEINRKCFRTAKYFASSTSTACSAAT